MNTKAPGMERFDRRDLILGLLAIASSATDVIAFVKMQQIFTSAMTGNTALLGLALGQGNLIAAIHSIVALAGYIAGVAFGAALPLRSTHRDLLLLLCFEAAFLAAFFAQWQIVGFPSGGAWLYSLIATSAMGMGMQSVAARKVNLDGIPTVVFTSTLTSLVMTLMHAGMRRGAISIFTAKRQLLAFIVYGCGAGLTAVLLLYAIDVAIALPLMVVAAAVLVHITPKRPVQGVAI